MKYILLIFCLLAMQSCGTKNAKNEMDAEIHYNISFDDISASVGKTDKLFCITLADSAQVSYGKYIKSLNKDYDHLKSKAFFNIVDINKDENKWFLKWLNPTFLPLTCVFSNEAQLIDVIPGATKETFLYIEEALKNKMPTNFHWPNRFNANKKTVIPFLNNVLETKKYLDHGIFILSKFDQFSDSLNYPYSIYLKLAGELMQNDSVASKLTAEALLALETPAALNLYKDEFITAKTILHHDFDINTEPNIRVDSTTISFDCRVNEKIPLSVCIYNDGEKPLKISNIYISCSCLERVGEEEITIPAKKSQVIDFYFTPEHEGDILRDIYINSNAINMPILHISILAKVN